MLNKVMIIGRLGRDPDIRQVGDNSVANFSVAVTEKFKDRNGQQQEKTEWVNVACWRRLAEIAQQYLTKGSLLYIEGKLQTRKWQDKDGAERQAVEVVADNFQMLGSPAGRQSNVITQQQALNPFAQPTTYEPRFAEGQNLTPAPEDDLPF